MKKLLFITTVITLIVFNYLFAQSVEFSSSVDRQEVPVNETLRLTVTLSGENVDNAPNPTLPQMTDFTVVSTSSSSSTSISVVNGRVSSLSTINYEYYLKPQREGDFVIGSVSIKFKGKEYKTNPINIKVVSASQSTTQPRTQPRTSTQRGGQTAQNIGDNIFLSASANKKEVYVGEQIIVDYNLYNRLQLQNLSLSKTPTYTGFWSEELFSAKQLDVQYQIINNKRYGVSFLKRVALFPINEGEFTLDPMELECSAVFSSNDFFDFFGTVKTFSISSSPITIKVKPLPPGKPQNFYGLVGNYNISVSLDKSEGLAFEPITMNIKIQGTGNIKAIKEPQFNLPIDLKKYESKEHFKRDDSNSIVSGYKMFEYILVPQADGDYQLEPLSLSFFDPVQQQYKTVSTKPIFIKALKNPNASIANQNYVFSTQKDVIDLGKDIRYIKSDVKKLSNYDLFVFKRIYYWSGYILSIALFILFFYQRKSAIALEKDEVLLKSRKAYNSAMKHFNKIKVKDKDFYGKIQQGLIEYFSNKFNVPISDIGKDKIIDTFKLNNINSEFTDKFIEIMSICDVARFAPSKLVGEKRDVFLKDAIKTIKNIETAVKSKTKIKKENKNGT